MHIIVTIVCSDYIYDYYYNYRAELYLLHTHTRARALYTYINLLTSDMIAIREYCIIRNKYLL